MEVALMFINPVESIHAEFCLGIGSQGNCVVLNVIVSR